MIFVVQLLSAPADATPPLPRRTRLAPSPTGALHLGNARTFLINWLLARQNGWQILLRIEDLDGPRVKVGADQQAIEDLQWLGLDFDYGPIFQSARQSTYTAAVDELLRCGTAYPCICSRREVEQAASAPHAEDGATIYPGTCRDRFASVAEAQAISGRPPAIRFRVPDRKIRWTDRFAGEIKYDPARQLGDFVISKTIDQAAYQLAVVIDDAGMGITDIVRGDDLLDSTPRQLLLYNGLGLQSKIPSYWHFPLVIGSDGRRLAKRHGDTRLAHFREMGVPAERILALMGQWLGIDRTGGAISLRELQQAFRLESVPRAAITLTASDEAFLLDGPSKTVK